MMNPFKEINWSPGPAERRKFAVSLVIGFPCVAALLLLAGWVKTGAWNLQPPLLVGGVGALLGVILWLVPAIARPFYIVWYAIACAIGLVVGNLLLAIVYYVFLTGIGLVRRTGRRQPIRKTLDKNAASYWETAEQPSDPSQYYRQY